MIHKGLIFLFGGTIWELGIVFASLLMVADDSWCLHMKSEYSDKNERVPRFILVFTGLTLFLIDQMCICPHQNLGRGWRRETGLSHPVKYFTDRSNAVLLLWIICVIYVSL